MPDTLDGLNPEDPRFDPADLGTRIANRAAAALDRARDAGRPGT